MTKKVLTFDFSEPLASEKATNVAIDSGDGNLTIDSLKGGEPVLASGTLQYLENQELPIRSVTMSNGQAALTLKASIGKQPWLRLPWAACNGATTWHVHLNPSKSADITAHSNGGNVWLDLSSMQVTHVAADTGGGNMDVILPEHAANLNVTAKTGAGAVSVEIGSLVGSNLIEASSGAGNVAVNLPGSIAARIHATSGMGKVVVDPCFSQIDKTTYQTPDYDRAANRVEITAASGVGNVIISAKVSGI